MRAVFHGFVAAAVLSLLPLAAAADEEEEIALDKVPKKALQVVKEKYPGAELISATKSKEEKHSYYSVVLKYNNEQYEVTLTPKGVITEIAKAIDATALPQAVTDALEKKYPKAALGEIAELREPTEKDRLTYHVEITTADNKGIGITFDPDGKILEENEDDDP